MTASRDIVFEPGYDMRPKAPGDKNYGIHSMHIKFVVKSEDLVIVFDVNTGWYPTSVEGSWRSGVVKAEAMGWYLSWHCTKPLTEDSADTRTSTCGWLGGKPCHSGSIGTMDHAYELFKLLADEGGEALWSKLESIYQEWDDRRKKLAEDEARYS